MPYYDLLDAFETNDDMNEDAAATTMGDIAYLPTHLGAVKAAVNDLRKKKREWNIEVLENEDSRLIRFEEDLQITVPNEHWDHFQNELGSLINEEQEIDERQILEDEEAEMKSLRKELKKALNEFFSNETFNKVDRNVQAWKNRFGAKEYLTDAGGNTLVMVETKQRDIQRLYGNLLRKYGKDRGNLELLIDSLKNDEHVDTFEVFRGASHLYGTRIRSISENHELIFESKVDNLYYISETIFIRDDELVDEVSESVIGVKVVGQVVYPLGEMFPPTVFKAIESAIYDIIRGDEDA